MADMKTARVVFDDFSGGDYGRDWSGMDTPNKFRAINVIEYDGGWIGPRKPVVRIEVPADDDSGDIDATNDKFDDPATHRSVWFFDNNFALTSDGHGWYFSDRGRRTSVALDDVGLMSDYFVTTLGFLWMHSVDTGDQAHGTLSIFNNGTGDFRPEFNTIGTDGAKPDGGLRVDRYNDTVVNAAFRQFQWSDGLIVDSGQAASVFWPAANTSDIFTRAIYDLIEQKNTLVVLAGSYEADDELSSTYFQRGTNRPMADVYVVYGALGADATLRKVDSGPEPRRTARGAYIWTTAGDNVWWINKRKLMRFDGAEVVVLPAPLPRIHPDDDFNYGPNAYLDYVSAASLSRNGEQILAGVLLPTEELADNEDAFLRKAVFVWSPEGDGTVWTAHDPGIEFHADEYSVAGGGPFPGAAPSGRGNSVLHVTYAADTASFCTGGSADATWGEAPRVYIMNTETDFPDTSLDDGDTGAPVKADFYTHDYWDPQGREIYVEGVTIDYAYKPSATATDNQFKIEVESLQLYDDDRPRGGGEVTFQAPTSGGESSEPGDDIIRGRISLPARSSGSGNGFRIHLSDWSGIAIRRISADVRFTPAR